MFRVTVQRHFFFFFFFWINYCAPRETLSHVALRDCVLYCVCNARYEGSNDSGFFSHSEGAIDTQSDYKELTGAAYARQMTVMPVVIRVPSGLLNAKSAAAQKRARAVALRGEKRRRGVGSLMMRGCWG